MDAHNLAVVFGPTLIRVSEEDDMISSQGHFNKVIETIIKSYDVVFDGEGLDTVDHEDEEEEDETRHTEDELSRDDSDSEEGKRLGRGKINSARLHLQLSLSFSVRFSSDECE